MADPRQIAVDAALVAAASSTSLGDLLRKYAENLPSPEWDSPESDNGLIIMSAALTGLADRIGHLAALARELLRADDFVDAYLVAARESLIFSEDQTQLAEVDVYLDTDDLTAAEALENALRLALREENITPVFEGPVRWGSWRRKLAVRLGNKDAFDKVVGAIETEHLRIPQSIANLNNASAVANLAIALQPIPNVAIRLGSLLVIKVTDNGAAVILTIELTEHQMELLGRNPTWMTHPKDLLELLEVPAESPMPGVAPQAVRLLTLPEAQL